MILSKSLFSKSLHDVKISLGLMSNLVFVVISLSDFRRSFSEFRKDLVDVFRKKQLRIVSCSSPSEMIPCPMRFQFLMSGK